jgi:hypothetical protein
LKNGVNSIKNSGKGWCKCAVNGDRWCRCDAFHLSNFQSTNLSRNSTPSQINKSIRQFRWSVKYLVIYKRIKIISQKPYLYRKYLENYHESIQFTYMLYHYVLLSCIGNVLRQCEALCWSLWLKACNILRENPRSCSLRGLLRKAGTPDKIELTLNI